MMVADTTIKRICLALLIAAVLFSPSSSYAGGEKKPLRVYILVGQSNMVGTGAISTIDYIGDDPATAPLLKSILNEEGKPKTCERVWISSLNGKYRTYGGEGFGKLSPGYGLRREDPTKHDDCIGPEYTFGITMEQNYDGPILIIKTAWGGKSLHIEYRPPSAGEYQLPDELVERFRDRGDLEAKQAEVREYSGKYYRYMIEHVKKVLGDIKRVCPDYDQKAGYELAGFVWFQGWNDYVATAQYPQSDGDQQFASYSDLLCHFIRDVRKDLKAPELPFVIGVIGVNGNHTPGLFSGASECSRENGASSQSHGGPGSAPRVQGFRRGSSHGTVLGRQIRSSWDEAAQNQANEDKPLQEIQIGSQCRWLHEPSRHQEVHG